MLWLGKIFKEGGKNIHIERMAVADFKDFNSLLHKDKNFNLIK